MLGELVAATSATLMLPDNDGFVTCVIRRGRFVRGLCSLVIEQLQPMQVAPIRPLAHDMHFGLSRYSQFAFVGSIRLPRWSNPSNSVHL